MDVSRANRIERATQLDAWLDARPPDGPPEVVVAIRKVSTGRATVRLVDLEEVALCYGWVDTQTQRIDDEWYAIRFVPRSPRSTWGPKNRAMAARLLAAGRVHPEGLAALPADLAAGQLDAESGESAPDA
jgi:uncharacterized protein YdeI (YjbR/CyaY-like superfamily)